MSCYLLVGSENNATISWSWITPAGVNLSSTDRFKIESSTSLTTLTINNAELGDKEIINAMELILMDTIVELLSLSLKVIGRIRN